MTIMPDIHFFTSLLTSTILASIGALLLLFKSIYDFSQTGPQLRSEILDHFYSYSIYALLRLTFWAFLIILWAGLAGNLVYIAWQGVTNQPISLLGSSFSAIFAIISISFSQFCTHLIEIPSSIMMSSQYRMTRFNVLWSMLSITRVRWLRLSIIVPATTLSIIYLLQLLFNKMWLDFVIFTALTTLIYGPFIWNIWPKKVKVHKAKTTKNSKPNIIMIGCDTLRADRVGDTNRPQSITPFIDALSQKGARFLNCYTPLARTAPSLVSIFTGTWPNQHGIRSNFVEDHQTTLKSPALATILKQQGYSSATISDWSGSDFGKFTFGFDHVETPEDQWNLRYLLRQGPKDIRLFLSLFTHNRFGKKVLPELYYLAGIPLTSHLGTSTCKWISRFAEEGKPFLLNTFMATAHPPFGSEYPYYTWQSKAEYNGESKFAMARLTDPFEIIRQQQEPKEAFDLDQITDLYDGCVRSFDDEVRRIVHHVEACNLANNTIIVIYSDHGMEFFEHNTWGQGNSALGEASAKIPLIIVDPRNKQDTQVKQVTRTIDLLPTLLELCDVAIPNEVEGTSLVPLLNQEKTKNELIAYFETGEWLATPPGTHPEHLTYPNLLELLEIPNRDTGTLSFKKDYQKAILNARDRMIRENNWKLVRLPLTSGPLYYLFDLDLDPACKNNISNKHPEIVARLAKKMEPWL